MRLRLLRLSDSLRSLLKRANPVAVRRIEGGLRSVYGRLPFGAWWSLTWKPGRYVLIDVDLRELHTWSIDRWARPWTLRRRSTLARKARS